MQGYKCSSCLATLMDVHDIGSLLDDWREVNSSCYKLLHPTRRHWLPYSARGNQGCGESVKVSISWDDLCSQLSTCDIREPPFTQASSHNSPLRMVFVMAWLYELYLDSQDAVRSINQHSSSLVCAYYWLRIISRKIIDCAEMVFWESTSRVI